MSDEEYDNEQVQKTRAGIARCWVKYCVNLLKDSVKNKQESDVDEDKVNNLVLSLSLTKKVHFLYAHSSESMLYS